MKRIVFLFFFCCFFFLGVIAQIPAGYYNGTENLSGIVLQQKLHDIIKNHDVQSYSSLHTHFESTDKKTNGKVWDMYSDIPGGTPPYQFTFGNTCGSYSQESDCYNREHSFPQSWFNSQSPMQSDLFHVYPTDGFVNGKRSNYPFGEVDVPDWTSQNGSRLGPSSTQGYSGTVFEPIDAYKGDFARTYFYMAVRYYTEDNGWSGSDMVNGSQPKTWALDVLKKWHEQDTVSQKETARNNAVYQIQKNRNPFIDHPEFTFNIWGGTPSSTEELYSQTSNISFTPNPAHDFIYISHSPNYQKIIYITLFDILGKQAGNFQIAAYPDNQNILIDLSNIPKGFYIIEYSRKFCRNNKLMLY